VTHARSATHGVDTTNAHGRLVLGGLAESSAASCHFSVSLSRTGHKLDCDTGATGRTNVKYYLWAAFIAMVMSVAIVRFAHVRDPIASYSFLLTDWISRPDMVSQCIIKLNRGPDPQEQEVWKAMGIEDPATQPYLGRLHYCYEGFWGWQRALRSRSG
jgi:hypothetical protein